MAKQIYLDYAAATPMADDACKAMEPYFSDIFYNPSATYLAGRAVRSQLEDIRHNIAQILGARPAEIVFTAGATEANNLAIQGVLSQYPDGEVLISAIEHESVLEPAKLFNHKLIPIDTNGQIILNKLSNLISDKTVLVSVMLVNNEIGSVQPLKDISQVISKIRYERLSVGNKLPIYLHTDAAQAGNYLDLHVSRLGVDLMSINGGKIYGPKQSGVLYIKAGVIIKPMIVGGGQEFGMRSGTENVAAAAGFAKALELAQQTRAAESKKITDLRQLFEAEFLGQIPNAAVNGGRHRAPHIVSLTIPGTDNERLMMELDEAGIICAVGSACSASSDEPSHVLKAMGLNESEARATLRFSLGKFTAKEDIQTTVTRLARLTAANR